MGSVPAYAASFHFFILRESRRASIDCLFVFIILYGKVKLIIYQNWYFSLFIFYNSHIYVITFPQTFHPCKQNSVFLLSKTFISQCWVMNINHHFLEPKHAQWKLLPQNLILVVEFRIALIQKFHNMETAAVDVKMNVSRFFWRNNIVPADISCNI